MRHILTLLLTWLLALAGHFGTALAAEPVKIGVLSIRPKPQAISQWQPLATALKQALPGRDFSIEVFNYQELNLAIAARQLDFAITSPSHYIFLSKRYGMSAPLATVSENLNGKPVSILGGTIFIRADDRKISSLPDLKGKVIAAASSESLYSYQSQAYELMRAGVRLPQDARMLFTGTSNDKVIEAVLSGQAEAGLVRAGALEEMAQEDKLDMAQVRVINRQHLPEYPVQVSTRLYPGRVFAALPHIDENLSRRIAAVLFLLEENRGVVSAMNIHGFLIPADYTAVADLLRELRLPPFDGTPEFTLHDIWRRYNRQLVAAMIITILVLLLGILVLANYRRLKVMHVRLIQQQHQLAESEFRWKFALEGAGDGVWDWNPQTDEALFSRQWKEMIGYAEHEFPGTGAAWVERLHPDDKERVLAAIQDYFTGKRAAYAAEFRLRCKDNSWKWILSRGMLISRDTSGKPLRMIGTNTDLTARKLAEQKLELSAQMLNSISDTVFLLDPAGNFIYLNEAAWKTRGYTHDEMMAMNLRDLNTPEFNKLLPSRMRDIMKNGRGFFESAHRCKNGSIMPIEINVRVIEAGGKKVLLSVIRDITERKAAQKQMEEQLAFTEAIINAEVNGLSVCHAIPAPPYTCFTVWNSSMEKLTGYSMEEINRLGWYQTVYATPEEQGRAQQRMARMRQGDHLHGEEWTITRKDGKSRIIQIYTVAVSTNKEGAHTLAIMRDITDHKQAEAELRASKERYRQIIKTSMDGFWLCDTTGNLLDVNDAYCQMTGYTREELLKMHISDIEAKETPEEVARHVQELREKGYLRFETLHRCKDGRRLVIEVSVVHWKNINKDYFFTFLRNITESKKKEEELKRSNTELEQFGYAVSHDMRQPLRMIASYLQLIEMGLGNQLDAEQRSYLDFAIDGAKRIDQMLVAMLEYSRVGRTGAPPARIDSSSILNEALLYLQPAITESKASITISGNWPHIHANRDEIQRLVQNLTGNALKFRVPGRKPEIMLTSSVAGKEWHFCVTDNGIGIIPSQIKRLFQIFQRLQPRTAYEGNGVGLAMCRKITEHHKGRIWAESEGEGQGSQFHVVLPVAMHENSNSSVGKSE